MKKILSFVAAMLVAFAVNAQTDFASPGYYCAADDAVLTGGSSSSFYLYTDADPHYVAWSDVSLSSNALATWTVEATRGCYITVAMDLGPVIASNKHIFEVKIYDANKNLKGTLTEPGENTDSEQVKAFDGTILLPKAGTYTVELRNNRDWGKGTIKNLILTYASDAPSEMIDVTAVELNKKTVTLELEEVEQLFATVSPADATDPTVIWVSSDPTIATVSEAGFVTAIAEGNATITAKAGEKSDECVVTIVAATVPDVDFAEPYAMTAKKAHLEGAIWKMYTDDAYKLYGDGGSNKNYGNAIWTLNVTRPCIVSGMLNGVEGGHLFLLDMYKGEELVASIIQPEDKKWNAGEIALDGTLTIEEAGAYTFILRNTQEWSSGKTAGVTLTYEGAPAPVIPTVAIAGNMNGWDANANVLVLADDSLTASATINLTDYCYEFKVVVDGVWLSLGNDPEDLYTLHRDWNKVSGLEADKQNFKLLPDVVPGDYTFVWTFATGELEIIFPEKPLPVVALAGEMNSWNAEVDILTPAEDQQTASITVTLNEARGYEFKMVVDGHWLAKDAMYEVKRDWATVENVDQEIPMGPNLKLIADAIGEYTFTWTYATKTLVVTFPDLDPEGIRNTNATVKTVKAIENGQLVIIKKGVRYNAIGTEIR